MHGKSIEDVAAAIRETEVCRSCWSRPVVVAWCRMCRACYARERRVGGLGLMRDAAQEKKDK